MYGCSPSLICFSEQSKITDADLDIEGVGVIRPEQVHHEGGSNDNVSCHQEKLKIHFFFCFKTCMLVLLMTSLLRRF